MLYFISNSSPIVSPGLWITGIPVFIPQTISTAKPKLPKSLLLSAHFSRELAGIFLSPRPGHEAGSPAGF
jgi:hypothetical protein